MKSNKAKNASKTVGWEVFPFKAIDLGSFSDKLTSKTMRYLGINKMALVQAWDELNNSWIVPWCDISQRQAELVIKRWCIDLVCRDQLPLWALENYTRAADEEGETYLNRYRHLFVSIRTYCNWGDRFMSKTQEVEYSLLFVPTTDAIGMTWRAVRILQPNVSPREAIGDYMSGNRKSYKELSWTAKRLPWELTPPKKSSEQAFCASVR
jgi:hypothetical protein